MLIGVLALQGAFIEHAHMLNKLAVDNIEIRQSKDLNNNLDGLIIPGGESTVIGKLLHDLNLFHPVQQLIQDGLPVLGTCAGTILLAQEIVNDSRHYFQSMPISARRNAYGRQLGSFTAKADFAGQGEIPMVFIRAPYIQEALTPDVKILATVHNKIVAARWQNQLATCFHPELTDNPTVHKYFMTMIEERAGEKTPKEKVQSA